MIKASGVRVQAWQQIVDVATQEGLRVWSTTIPSLCIGQVEVSSCIGS